LTDTPFPNSGYVRIKQIMRPDGAVLVSRRKWWDGVRSGRYPRPVELGPRITASVAQDILALLATGTE
jgi:predicted DNA-binding transcriptional regulator AlpA